LLKLQHLRLWLLLGYKGSSRETSGSHCTRVYARLTGHSRQGHRWSVASGYAKMSNSKAGG